jgi:membrane protein implicated in regulation of membrane protease activity
VGFQAAIGWLFWTAFFLQSHLNEGDFFIIVRGSPLSTLALPTLQYLGVHWLVSYCSFLISVCLSLFLGEDEAEGER